MGKKRQMPEEKKLKISRSRKHRLHKDNKGSPISKDLSHHHSADKEWMRPMPTSRNDLFQTNTVPSKSTSKDSKKAKNRRLKHLVSKNRSFPPLQKKKRFKI